MLLLIGLLIPVGTVCYIAGYELGKVVNRIRQYW